MKSKLLRWVVEELLKNLTPELLKIVVGAILTAIEDYVKTTPDPSDDKWVLPLLDVIRKVLDLPDDE